MSTKKEQHNPSSPPSEKQAAIEKANAFLKPGTDWSNFAEDSIEIFELAKSFQNNSNFSYARRLFQLLYNGIDDSINVIEPLAICTYKDTDLPSDTKYDAAIVLLENYLKSPGESIHDANINGLLGSIYKKKWQYENDDRLLYDSLFYYQEGYKIAEEGLKDSNPALVGKAVSFLGYCGINTAFVFDQLSYLNEQRKGRSKTADSASHYDEKAATSRKSLISEYQKYENLYTTEWSLPLAQQSSNFEELRKYWFFITLAEAHLGMGDFESASRHYKQALAYGSHPEWARHTASVQGFNILELGYKEEDKNMAKGRKAISILLGEEIGIPKIHTEKIGLALSGGGFRASLFHIGVLAQLAEKEILHKVETISCVSGGSIIGALYYLKLRKLLQEKVEILPSDYIDLVAEMKVDFIIEVQKNIRLGVLSSFRKNSQMAIFRSFTRTSHIAELYDKHFYNKVNEKESDILMKDLRIYPAYKKGETLFNDHEFNPVTDNWKRTYKIPALVINATTLNTGHCWQFTASWMGESPSYINSEFDALPTLRRMYYNEAGEHENVRLSTAVAASAGVPGIFAPVELENLYPPHEKVLLVDGGVHDNQGITALYEQECNLLIISDASGQMPEDVTPSDLSLNVLMRSNAIIQNRVRDVQFKELESRKRSGLVRDYLLVHFTKDLYGKIIDWKGCDNRFVLPKVKGLIKDDTITDYQIKKKIQYALARIRTDLDSFHDSEILGLMYSGYKITEEEIKKSPSILAENDVNGKDLNMLNLKEQWKFPELEAILKNEKQRNYLENTLNHSSSTLGKWFLFKFGKGKTKILRWSLLTITTILLTIILFKATFLTIGLALVVVIVGYLLSRLLGRNIFIIPLFFVLGIITAGLFKILQYFNKWYLSEGAMLKK